jgi:hypothetical protein
MKALRACETLRRHRNSEVGNPGRYVAAHERENVEGKKTAREAAVLGATQDGGVRAVRLWRGAKGYERIVWGV